MGAFAKFSAFIESPAQLAYFLRMTRWTRKIGAWRDANTIPGILSKVEPEKTAPVDPDRVDRYLTYLFRRRFWMPVNNCYTRSLLRYKFLREAGLEVGIRLGVRKENGEFKGHAWIVLDGAPYKETEDCNYTVTLAHPHE